MGSAKMLQCLPKLCCHRITEVHPGPSNCALVRSGDGVHQSR